MVRQAWGAAMPQLLVWLERAAAAADKQGTCWRDLMGILSETIRSNVMVCDESTTTASAMGGKFDEVASWPKGMDGGGGGGNWGGAAASRATPMQLLRSHQFQASSTMSNQHLAAQESAGHKTQHSSSRVCSRMALMMPPSATVGPLQPRWAPQGGRASLPRTAPRPPPLPPAARPSPAAAMDFQRAASFDDLLEANLRYLRGEGLRDSPFHHGPLAAETAPLVSSLARLHTQLRMFTVESQPGLSHARWVAGGESSSCEASDSSEASESSSGGGSSGCGAKWLVTEQVLMKGLDSRGFHLFQHSSAAACNVSQRCTCM